MPIEACRPAYRQPRIGDLQAGQETECDPLWTCGQRKGVDHMSTAATTSAEGFNNSSHTKILTLPTPDDPMRWMRANYGIRAIRDTVERGQTVDPTKGYLYLEFDDEAKALAFLTQFT